MVEERKKKPIFVYEHTHKLIMEKKLENGEKSVADVVDDLIPAE